MTGAHPLFLVRKVNDLDTSRYLELEPAVADLYVRLQICKKEFREISCTLADRDSSQVKCFLIALRNQKLVIRLWRARNKPQQKSRLDSGREFCFAQHLEVLFDVPLSEEKVQGRAPQLARAEGADDHLAVPWGVKICVSPVGDEELRLRLAVFPPHQARFFHEKDSRFGLLNTRSAIYLGEMSRDGTNRGITPLQTGNQGTEVLRCGQGGAIEKQKRQKHPGQAISFCCRCDSGFLIVSKRSMAIPIVMALSAILKVGQ